MSTGVQQFKDLLYQRTRACDAGSDKTIPDWVRRIKICIGGRPNPVRLQWGLTPVCVHFKDIFPCWKELWNLRSGAISYYPGPWGVEALYSRIAPHHDCFLRPQKLDVFPGGQKTKSTTSTMVSLPIRVQRQIGSHRRNENSTVRHPF